MILGMGRARRDGAGGQEMMWKVAKLGGVAREVRPGGIGTRRGDKSRTNIKMINLVKVGGDANKRDGDGSVASKKCRGQQGGTSERAPLLKGRDESVAIWLVRGVRADRPPSMPATLISHQ